jgi:hypothetical protein
MDISGSTSYYGGKVGEITIKGFIGCIVRKDCTSEASGLAVIERLPTD